MLRSAAEAALRRLSAGTEPGAVSASLSWTAVEAEASVQVPSRGRSRGRSGGRSRGGGSSRGSKGPRRGSPAAAAGAAAPPAPPRRDRVPRPPPTVDPLGAAERDCAGSDDPAACGRCRFPCHLSGAEACGAAEYLHMWDAESYMKPAFFDSMWTGQPPNTSGARRAVLAWGLAAAAPTLTCLPASSLALPLASGLAPAGRKGERVAADLTSPRPSPLRRHGGGEHGRALQRALEAAEPGQLPAARLHGRAQHRAGHSGGRL